MKVGLGFNTHKTMTAGLRGLSCTIWVSFAIAIRAQVVFGHGVPIDVVAVDGKLTPFLLDSLPAEIASLQEDLVTGIVSANSPGFGVTNSANQIRPGTALGLNVVSPLGYFDGTQLVEPATTLRIDSPVGFDSYVVGANTGEQTGFNLGVFSGFPFWEADSSYTLESPEAGFGLYGFLAQVTSPSYVDSDPFLFPLVYDPEFDLGPTGFRSGVSALRGLFEESSSETIYDVNQDGLLNGSDVDQICAAVGSNDESFDLNTDGQVSVADVEAWLAANSSSNGDADLDGNVSFSDFLILTANFATSDNWTHGNFNCDGTVSFPDFLILSSNFGSIATSFPASSVESVPEPSSGMWTIIFSLLALRFTYLSTRST